jgi:hypothetical protein
VRLFVFLTLLLSACGSGTSATIGPGPVSADSIRLVLGGDVYLTGDQVGDGKLVNLRRVSPPAASVDVIHLQLTKESGPSDPAFVLTVDNFFARPFGFQGFTELSTNLFISRESCSVMPGVSDVEQVPDSTTAFIFQDVQFRAPGSFCE